MHVKYTKNSEIQKYVSIKDTYMHATKLHPSIHSLSSLELASTLLTRSRSDVCSFRFGFKIIAQKH